MDHVSFIRRCLELAEQGRGKVGINPLVGSVLVRKGKVIAEGHYDHFGAEHAEASLLASFTKTIEPTDILYVNLEPCCHQGLRPPCTDAILKSGVRTIVYGMQDPDARVAGKGIEKLRAAGLTVIGPVIPVECQRQNRGYISLRTQQRPWVTLKRAQTRAGAIAKPDGGFLKITSLEQDEWSHEFLRARHDAILVGIGTVLTDNPRLTVRLPADRSAKRAGSNKKVDQFIQPWRVILDSQKRLPAGAHVSGDRCIALQGLSYTDGTFDWQELWHTLTTPTETFPGISSLIVEGGQKTWDSFRKAKMFDEEVILVGE